jgi:phosphopantothenate---cysteine ligase (CTP)
LQRKLQASAKSRIDAVFHAAAVSDFSFGRVWRRTATGRLRRVQGGKITSRAGILLAELKPTLKIIMQLRDWYPGACLVGWKYEVDGDRAEAVAHAESQMQASQTDACVVNGPAYGRGFGLVAREGQVLHLAGRRTLFAALERLVGT